jgi:DNA-binding NarL/FixJ family response regulator
MYTYPFCGFDYRLKMARNKDHYSQTRQSILVLKNEGYSMREIAKKL